MSIQIQISLCFSIQEENNLAGNKKDNLKGRGHSKKINSQEDKFTER